MFSATASKQVLLFGEQRISIHSRCLNFIGKIERNTALHTAVHFPALARTTVRNLLKTNVKALMSLLGCLVKHSVVETWMVPEAEFLAQ